MEKDVKEAARAVHESDDVLIVSHIDADGISSAAIAYTACLRSKTKRLIDRFISDAYESIDETDLALKLDNVLAMENMVDEHRMSRYASIIVSSERLLQNGCDDPDAVKRLHAVAENELKAVNEKIDALKKK